MQVWQIGFNGFYRQLNSISQSTWVNLRSNVLKTAKFLYWEVTLQTGLFSVKVPHVIAGHLGGHLGST